VKPALLMALGLLLYRLARVQLTLELARPQGLLLALPEGTHS
jgi:hypothetical protein